MGRRWLGYMLLPVVLARLILQPFIGLCEEWTENVLENKYVALSFDAQGELSRIYCKKTGHCFLNDAQCGYTLTVNTSTGDIWKSAQGNLEELRTGDAPAEMALHREADAQVLTIRQRFALETGDILLVRKVRLPDDSGVASFAATIENTCTHAAVTKVKAMALHNLTDTAQGLSLLWPDKEGEIHAGALGNMTASRLSLSYPSPMSMQYVALFDQTQGLYYGVHDEQRQYKEFTFRRSGEVSCTLYPFVGAGATAALPAVCLGVTGGGWYEAADIYRAWLVKSGFQKSHAPLAESFTGVASSNLSRYADQYKVQYTGYDVAGVNMVQQSAYHMKKYGTNLTIFLGWHERGFDSRYPDYRFIESYGGEERFAKAMQEMHEKGGRAAMYLNVHIADTLSDWYNAPNENGSTNGEACAIRTKYGAVLHEDYGTGLDYVAMCPMAESWQQALVDAAERLRRNGADALWMDQLMEMPAELCYDPSHGHSTPATAYAEGYDRLLRRLNDVMAQHGDDSLFCCEGVCDAYLQQVDICGMMWARLLGHSPESAPEITRYTLPAKFFGLPTAGGAAGTQSQYGDAWVMANGMLARDDNAVCRRFAALCRQYPDVFFTGRYLDQAPLEALPEGWKAGVILAEDKSRAAVQLWNRSTRSSICTLRLTAAFAQAYGFTRAMDAETGAELDWNDGGWQIEAAAGKVSSLLLYRE